MDRQKALDQLKVMQAWHEDFGNGPCPDYDAICYAIGVIEEAPEGLDNLIKALEQEHKKLLEMQKALKNVPDTNVGDTISRQAAIDALRNYLVGKNVPCDGTLTCRLIENEVISKLPSAQPKRGKWILDRSGAYCCSECMEPCAGYVMMRPRDKFCKMCGAKMEVTE